MGIDSNLQFFIFENRHRIYNFWQRKNFFFYSSILVFSVIGYMVSFNAVMSQTMGRVPPFEDVASFIVLVGSFFCLLACKPYPTNERKTIGMGIGLFLSPSLLTFFSFTCIIILIKWLIIH